MTPPAQRSSAQRFLVRLGELATARVATYSPPALQPGEVRLKVGSFALTSNNITYAAYGDAMSYWQFFPTGEDGWGCIPVWGFATVSESACPGIEPGEQLYGYLPMGSELIVLPQRINAGSFVDAMPHRAGLPAVYNQYMRSAADPFHRPGSEDIQSLLRPLFITSFLIDDFLADNDFFGATATGRGAMLLSSASSKTAYGTAFQLAQRQELDVIGLTSARNVGFCESLGCYSRVLTYDQLDATDAATPCIYVDFAGNAGLRRRIHERFVQLKYSCSIGGTHVDELAGPGSSRDLPVRGPCCSLRHRR